MVDLCLIKMTHGSADCVPLARNRTTLLPCCRRAPHLHSTCRGACSHLHGKYSPPGQRKRQSAPRASLREVLADRNVSHSALPSVSEVIWLRSPGANHNWGCCCLPQILSL